MKSNVRFAFATLALAFAAATTTVAAEPGYVDFGKLVGPAKGDFVNVSLGKGVLKLAALVTKCKNPEAAQLISGLSRVRVNVVGLDDTNRESTTERVHALRQELVRDGWDQIVEVRGKKQEDVAVFLKQRDGEVIDGLVVTVIDERKKEAVLVNIVGQIRAEQLSMLGEHLEIKELRLGGKPAKS